MVPTRRGGPPPPERECEGPDFLFEMPRLTASGASWSRASRPRQGEGSCAGCGSAFWACFQLGVMPGKLAERSPCRPISCTALSSKKEPRRGWTARLLKLGLRPLRRRLRSWRVALLPGVDLGQLCACRSDPQRRCLPSRGQRHLTLIRHHGLADSSKPVEAYTLGVIGMVFGDVLLAASSVRVIIVYAQVMLHRAGWGVLMSRMSMRRCGRCSLDVCHFDPRYDSISITHHSIRSLLLKKCSTVRMKSLFWSSPTGVGGRPGGGGPTAHDQTEIKGGRRPKSKRVVA